MHQAIETTTMLADRRFRYDLLASRTTCRQRHYFRVPRVLLKERPMRAVVPFLRLITSLLPTTLQSNSSSQIRHIFGAQCLWQRQSQVAWKWVYATAWTS
jgi:hypothetical protein